MPGPLAILGGGQLARMTVQAASALGIDVIIGDIVADSPAARLTSREIVFNGGWDDDEALAAVAAAAPVVTLESEFVDADVLRHLEAFGTRVLPPPECVAVVQDKLHQKEALRNAGIAVPPFRVVHRPDELARAAMELGWPLMLKARRDGYDGRGNALVRGASEAQDACRRLGWPERLLYVEAHVPFERELAVMVVRGRDEDLRIYPVVETRQDPEQHVCVEVLAPASLPDATAAGAAVMARQAVEAVGGVGAFGVELFLLRDGSVCVNELAPRPHNTGHYTIEACATSQFANHVRAVLGLPLGHSGLRLPAAAMVNLLGSAEPDPASLTDALAAGAAEDVSIHLYGKRESRPGRKMGHVTALGETAGGALALAHRVAARLVV